MKTSTVSLIAILLTIGVASPASAGSRSGRLLANNAVRVASADRQANAFDGLIATYASASGVPVSLAHAVIRVESNYNPGMRGSAGEIGLMQVKLQTARGMGYRGTAKALYDPSVNIKYGMMYLGKARALAGGDLCHTILKYNGGHGATRMSRGPAIYCGKVQQFLAMN
jgi:soluble lytic murein transglycosylase-like protein